MQETRQNNHVTPKQNLFVGFKKHNSILNGGGLANLRCLKMLQGHYGEENVDTIYVHDEGNRRPWHNLIMAVPYTLFDYHNGISPQFVKHIVKESHKYESIFLSTSLFGIVAKALKENNYKGTIITHFHNVEGVYYNALIPRKLPLRSIFVKCAEHNDRYSCLYSDKIIVLNKRDGNLLHSLYGRKPEILLPISLQDKCTPIPKDEALTATTPLCLFIGSSFGPNNEGVLWFVQNVLPNVDIRFKVVGKDMAKLQANNACMKDIEVISDAPDLTPYFTEADFMVLPIFSGSGMKVKTCESLMYGKNILGTDETFEGYDLDTDKVGGRCNTAEDYIRCLNHYKEHPMPRFNKYSRQVYTAQYSESTVKTLFATLFENK